MTGIIKRTVCYMNKISVFFVALVFVMIIRSFFGIDPGMDPFEAMIAPLMNTVIASCLPLAVIFAETSSGMTKWLMTSPMKTSAYVREKYIVAYFFLIFFGLSASIHSVIFMNKTTGFDIKQYLLILAVIFGVVSLALSVTVPIMLRTSSVAGLSVYIFTIMALLAVFLIASIFLSSSEAGLNGAVQLINSDKLVIALIILAAAAVFPVISYFISVRLLKNKQF